MTKLSEEKALETLRAIRNKCEASGMNVAGHSRTACQLSVNDDMTSGATVTVYINMLQKRTPDQDHVGSVAVSARLWLSSRLENVSAELAVMSYAEKDWVSALHACACIVHQQLDDRYNAAMRVSTAIKEAILSVGQADPDQSKPLTRQPRPSKLHEG